LHGGAPPTLPCCQPYDSRYGRRALHCGISIRPMSALGHKQTLRRRLGQVRFPPQSGHARDHLDASALCHGLTYRHLFGLKAGDL